MPESTAIHRKPAAPAGDYKPHRSAKRQAATEPRAQAAPIPTATAFGRALADARNLIDAAATCHAAGQHILARTLALQAATRLAGCAA